MFIASQTSQWVYGCPVNWETPLRIYIITSWCKLLTISLSLPPSLPLSHRCLLLVTFNTFNIKNSTFDIEHTYKLYNTFLRPREAKTQITAKKRYIWQIRTLQITGGTFWPKAPVGDTTNVH